MNSLLPIVLSLFAGLTLASQPLANGRLSSILGSPLWAAAISVGVTSLICIAAAASLIGTVGFSSLHRVPWWAWTGGLFGIPSLVGMAWSVPRLGAAPVMVLIILGQLIAAVVIDWQKWSLAEASVSPIRMLGVGIVMIGAGLVVWK